ncbi:MAG: hypothetical protein U0892_10225 [Pirellulales bacterium]
MRSIRRRLITGLLVVITASNSAVCLTGCGGSAAPTSTAGGGGSAASNGTASTAADNSSASAAPESNSSATEGGTKAAAEPQTGSTPSTKPNSKPATPPVVAVPVPKVPEPTAEQVARWAIPQHTPLQLLTCLDGFGEPTVLASAVHPDGKRFATAGVQVALWDVGAEKPRVDLAGTVRELEESRPIHALSYSPDGKWLAAGASKGQLLIWKGDESAAPQVVAAHNGPLEKLAISPDSKSIATADYSGTIKLWQIEDGKSLGSIKAAQSEPTAMRFVTDDLLVVASDTTSVWSITEKKQVAALTEGRSSSEALGVSTDRKQILYAGRDGSLKWWNVESKADDARPISGKASGKLELSSDGKLLVGAAGDYAIHVWDATSGRLVQVIDTFGSAVTDWQWMPNSHLLILSSDNGRVRIWGTVEEANKAGVKPTEWPAVADGAADGSTTLSPAQLEKLIDLRTMPLLPDAKVQFDGNGMVSYLTEAATAEVNQFYHYLLSKQGWQVLPPDGPAQEGSVTFAKSGVRLSLGLVPAEQSGLAKSGTMVSLSLGGNVDVRRFSQIGAVESQAAFRSFAFDMYRSREDITKLETALIKQFTSAGWTATTRIDAAHAEDPQSRTLTFTQRTGQLMVNISRPVDEPQQWAVQVVMQLNPKSIPIPTDAGWIEFDSATSIKMVANTKMSIEETAAFYDREMQNEGWSARQALRKIDKERGFLPYIRGQNDLNIRLVKLESGATRVIVGEAEQNSWQLAEVPDPASVKKAGLEAADFPIAKGATDVKYNVDEKTIEFKLAETSPPKTADAYAELLKPLGWERDSRGVVSDDYTLATFKHGKAETALRIRQEGSGVSVQVGADELQWDKPLPTAAVRISYETWLKRNRYDATIDRLDAFESEMLKIPAPAAPAK